MNYTCSKCNKKHEIYFGSKVPIPEDINALLVKKSERIVEHNGVYLLDGKEVILEGVIRINTEFKEDFKIICWISVDAKDFIDNSQKFNSKEGMELEGVILSKSPFWFDKFCGLKVIAKFKSGQEYFDKAELMVEQKSEIQNHQINGFTKCEIKKLMASIHHPLIEN